MPAYLLVEIEITDPELFEEYKRLVAPTIVAFGGRYLARGGALESLEGGWDPRRLVIIEFPSMERARQWWESDAYAPLKPMRIASARSRLLLVEGT
jgi:uncharacterized protein (DUF1330 family)